MPTKTKYIPISISYGWTGEWYVNAIKVMVETDETCSNINVGASLVLLRCEVENPEDALDVGTANTKCTEA